MAITRLLGFRSRESRVRAPLAGGSDMLTVREGWVVFDEDGQQTSWQPQSSEDEAWNDAICTFNRTVSLMRSIGYTCRRVRVTIEELDQNEKGE